MKLILYFFSIVIFLSSCYPSTNQNNNVQIIDQNKNIQTVDPQEIQSGEIKHDTLSQEQIEKITRIQSTFEEVLPVSLEQTITNFKRDENVDSEIDIWLNMADAYENYLKSKQYKLNLETKQEVFKLLLSRSMMSNNEAIKNVKPEMLSEKEAREVLQLYSANPVQLKIIKKY
jgi:hypothetical protein